MRAWNLLAALLLSASVAFSETLPSLGTALTSGGEIMEGATGSFDPTGFHMEYGLGGEPLFVEEDSSPWEPLFPPAGQDMEGTWYPLGRGVDAPVYAIDYSDTGVLYAGGWFNQAGGSTVNHIASWNGSSWSELGGGVNDMVWAIAVSGSDVYAGGWFTQAGGNPASYIARWDGSSWSELGSGVNKRVWAIAVSGSDVYVGGNFTQAGGNPANYIARWNGSSWSAMGSGVNDYVYAITVSGSDVYVGGEFSQAGGNPANRIARWDGSSWSALGTGVNNWVWAVAVSGSDVYVGGGFTQAGGNPANYVARWDGSCWSAMGGVLNDEVYDIVLSGSDVYVGGLFWYPSWSPYDDLDGIAMWDGSSWHSLGSGVQNGSADIVVSGSGLYVGGYFTEAGGERANGIARWEPYTGIEPSPGMESSLLHASPNPTAAGIQLSFQGIGLSPLTLEIFDAAGRLVRTQDLGILPMGSQTHYWDGLDGNGHALTQGVYFLRLSSDELEAFTRVVLVR